MVLPRRGRTRRFLTPITRHTRKFARPSSSRMAMLADSSVLTSIAANAELLPRVAELVVGPVVLVSSGVAIVNGMDEEGGEEAEKDPNAEVRGRLAECQPVQKWAAAAADRRAARAMRPRLAAARLRENSPTLNQRLSPSSTLRADTVIRLSRGRHLPRHAPAVYGVRERGRRGVRAARAARVVRAVDLRARDLVRPLVVLIVAVVARVVVVAFVCFRNASGCRGCSLPFVFPTLFPLPNSRPSRARHTSPRAPAALS